MNQEHPMNPKHPPHQSYHSHQIHRKTKETDINIQINVPIYASISCAIGNAICNAGNSIENTAPNTTSNTTPETTPNTTPDKVPNTTPNPTTETETHIDTGVAFYDHMLTLFAFRAGLTLQIHAKGDLAVDTHHTIEDVGITLGLAVAALLGDKTGIARYGSARIPMDESLAQVDIDISGRPYLVCNADIRDEMLEEFFRAFTYKAGITLHINLLYGKNEHHKCEAIFKAFGAAFKQAITPTGTGVPSTKGVL